MPWRVIKIRCLALKWPFSSAMDVIATYIYMTLPHRGRVLVSPSSCDASSRAQVVQSCSMWEGKRTRPKGKLVSQPAALRITRSFSSENLHAKGENGKEKHAWPLRASHFHFPWESPWMELGWNPKWVHLTAPTCNSPALEGFARPTTFEGLVLKRGFEPVTPCADAICNAYALRRPLLGAKVARNLHGTLISKGERHGHGSHLSLFRRASVWRSDSNSNVPLFWKQMVYDCTARIRLKIARTIS